MKRNASHFEMWIDEVPTDEQLDEFLRGLNYGAMYCTPKAASDAWQELHDIVLKFRCNEVPRDSWDDPAMQARMTKCWELTEGEAVKS